jgi:hypothetical protein
MNATPTFSADMSPTVARQTMNKLMQHMENDCCTVKDREPAMREYEQAIKDRPWLLDQIPHSRIRTLREDLDRLNGEPCNGCGCKVFQLYMGDEECVDCGLLRGDEPCDD